MNCTVPELAELAAHLTRELVRLPSENRPGAPAPEAGVFAYLTDKFSTAGWECAGQEVTPGRANFLARRPRPGAPKLLITGHMDTVPAGGLVEPFAARVEAGRIHGRGACDDKGPLAAAAAVLLNLEPDDAAYDLTFAATVDEEGGMLGSSALAERLEPFALALALEPTALKPIKAHKGAARFVIECAGKACHSSQPQCGENAIAKAARAVLAVEAYARELGGRVDPELGAATVTATLICGGRAVNVVPDQCELTVDARPLPEMDPAQMIAELGGRLAGLGSIRQIFSGRGLRSDLDGAPARAFLAALAAEQLDASPGVVHYCTDCARLGHLGPCLVWGPGDIAQAHGDHEYIDLNQLTAAVGVLRRFLERSTHG